MSEQSFRVKADLLVNVSAALPFLSHLSFPPSRSLSLDPPSSSLAMAFVLSFDRPPFFPAVSSPCASFSLLVCFIQTWGFRPLFRPSLCSFGSLAVLRTRESRVQPPYSQLVETRALWAWYYSHSPSLTTLPAFSKRERKTKSELGPRFAAEGRIGLLVFLPFHFEAATALAGEELGFPLALVARRTRCKGNVDAKADKGQFACPSTKSRARSFHVREKR